MENESMMSFPFLLFDDRSHKGDEMCGMYIYYYGSEGQLLSNGNCETSRTPGYTYTWNVDN
jgi:hypothetical protein